MNTEVLKKIEEIKDWEGHKGEPFYKVKYHKLKEELVELFNQETGELYLVVGNYVLEKQYNPKLKKEIIAIYTKQSFERRENFLKNRRGFVFEEVDN